MPIRCELAKKKKNALHFTFDPDPAADRRAADVALQRTVGLRVLPQRRIRTAAPRPARRAVHAAEGVRTENQ